VKTAQRGRAAPEAVRQLREARGPRSRQELVAACHTLRDHVRARHLAGDDEVAEFWPMKPARANTWDWLWAYGQFMRLIAGEGKAPGALDPDAADQMALAALQEEPIEVETHDHILRVAPKSFEALLWFNHVDALLRWLTGRERALRAAMEAGTLPEAFEAPAEVLGRLVTEIAHQNARLVAQATADGPRLLPDLEPDERIRSLGPVELIRVPLAFLHVNSVRLSALKALVEAPKKGHRAVSWSTFMATAADHLRTDVRQLARDRSLVSLLAQVRLVQRSVDDELAEEA